MSAQTAIGISLLAALLGGCATYTTPGGPASMAALEPRAVAVECVGHGAARHDQRDSFARTPRARFPAQLIVVRIQAAGYARFSAGYGRGQSAW